MILNFIRVWVFLAALCSPFASQANTVAATEGEAQRLVHLLSYVGADYGGAVRDGVVVKSSEYEEQKALLGDASSIAERLNTMEVLSIVREIESLVLQKADAARVSEASSKAKRLVISTFALPQAPASPPNREHGRALYVEHCATCHGETGAADTDRARSLAPAPANFLNPERGGRMTPFGISNTIRFGVNGTAMIPFTFLSEAERWDLAFYVMSLRHAGAAPVTSSTSFTLLELATRSDDALASDLRRSGVGEASVGGMLSDLRSKATYEDRAQKSPIDHAKSKLDRASLAMASGDRVGAHALVVDGYLEGIELVEPSLRSREPQLADELEQAFMHLRAAIRDGTSIEATDALGRARELLFQSEKVLKKQGSSSFLSTALSSASIIVREGVEAALLIAALLALAGQAGLSNRKRYVHYGWAVALLLGALTWVLSLRLIQITGAGRETVEGATALLAMIVLFYVSYSLLAKREVTRWMSFLRRSISPEKAGLSLFFVSLLAAYREVFETVLFYQALAASSDSMGAIVVGVGAGALCLALFVLAYSRAGKFAPPQAFFRFSGAMLYLLAIVFAGQGVQALQVAGLLPAHIFSGPTIPALGLYPTAETLGLQSVLVLLAGFAYLSVRRGDAPVPARN